MDNIPGLADWDAMMADTDIARAMPPTPKSL